MVLFSPIGSTLFSRAGGIGEPAAVIPTPAGRQPSPEAGTAGPCPLPPYPHLRYSPIPCSQGLEAENNAGRGCAGVDETPKARVRAAAHLSGL